MGVGSLPASVLHPARIDRTLVIQWSVFALSIIIVFAPIIPIVYQSFIDRPIYDAGHEATLQNYTNLFSSPELPGVVFNSFAFAFLATLVSQILGALFAVLLGRTNMPGKRIFGSLLLYPHLISGLVLSLGWFLSYGSAGFVTLFFKSTFGVEPWSLYTITGMAIIAGTTQVPITLLYCLGSSALADPALEDAARSCGSRQLNTLRYITLPLMAPAILYSAVLNFTSALETLSIPLIFGEPRGIRFFTTFLYVKGLLGGNPDYGLVGTAAVLLLAIVALLVYLQGIMLRNTRRFVTVGGKASRPRPFDLGRLKWVAFAFVSIYTLLFVIVPILTLGLRAFVRFLTPLIPFWELLTLEHFVGVFNSAADLNAIGNSLIVALIGGTIATLLIALIAIVVHRSEFRYRKQLEYVALAPRALPGLIAGLGIFYAVLFFPAIGWLRETVLILIVALIMRAIPSGFGAIAPSLIQISPDLDRAVRVAGGDWWTATSAVTFRVLKPALFACFVLMFIAFFKDYATAVFLVNPGNDVIGTSILHYLAEGQTGTVAALGTIQILLTVLFIAIAQRALRVNVYGESKI